VAVIGKGRTLLILHHVYARRVEQILKPLAMLDINEGTVYPGLKKEATHIAKKYANEM